MRSYTCLHVRDGISSAAVRATRESGTPLICVMARRSSWSSVCSQTPLRGVRAGAIGAARTVALQSTATTGAVLDELPEPALGEVLDASWDALLFESSAGVRTSIDSRCFERKDLTTRSWREPALGKVLDASWDALLFESSAGVWTSIDSRCFERKDVTTRSCRAPLCGWNCCQLAPSA